MYASLWPTKQTIEDIRKLKDWKAFLQHSSAYAEVMPEGNMKRIVGVGTEYVTVLDKGRAVRLSPDKIRGIQY